MPSTASFRACRLAAGAGLFCAFAAHSAQAGILNTVTANGYVFTNFDPAPMPGAAWSNVNGLGNAGQVVGTQVDINNASVFSNFSGTPTALSALNTGAGQVAFGINSAGTVVGGNGTAAFYLPANGSPQTLTVPGSAINAFGINDAGAIVGQFTSGAATPGFVLPNTASTGVVTINAPAVAGGADVVNAQGINNAGLVVGFYLGADGQVHGLRANVAGVMAGMAIAATAVADPAIPTVAGEPGASFVFSQLLGVNTAGLVAGYYGDSTTSQHGFIYNAATGGYTFLDDPSVAFNGGGVEATQITGINDSGEIAGFYTDAGGAAHSFLACPVGQTCSASAVPEPGSLPLLAGGVAVLAGFAVRSGRCVRRA